LVARAIGVKHNSNADVCYAVSWGFGLGAGTFYLAAIDKVKNWFCGKAKALKINGVCE
jgi:hypothetical protein